MRVAQRSLTLTSVHYGRLMANPRDLAEQAFALRSEEHTSELQSPCNIVCRLLLEKKNISSPTPYPSVIDAITPYHSARLRTAALLQTVEDYEQVRLFQVPIETVCTRHAASRSQHR